MGCCPGSSPANSVFVNRPTTSWALYVPTENATHQDPQAKEWLIKHPGADRKVVVDCYHFGRHWIKRWTFPWITKLAEGILTALHARGEARGG